MKDMCKRRVPIGQILIIMIDYYLYLLLKMATIIENSYQEFNEVREEQTTKISPINARKRLIYEKIFTKIASFSSRVLQI